MPSFNIRDFTYSSWCSRIFMLVYTIYRYSALFSYTVTKLYVRAGNYEGSKQNDKKKKRVKEREKHDFFTTTLQGTKYSSLQP